jgi:hypothetical protein
MPTKSPSRLPRPLKLTAFGLPLLALAALAGCVEQSGGTWYVRSAAVPEGWPELTPVGEVQVKHYPTYRAAVVADADLGRGGMGPMFRTLFNHIKTNDIAMTAPVEMGYENVAAGRPRMASMAFLYGSPDLGRAGEAGRVRVRDLEPQMFASVGVRGDYTTGRFLEGLGLLEAWLEANAEEWSAAGPPRYLGYNSPFVPGFMRYGEVQVPVEHPPVVSAGTAAEAS